jgi:hypothetical protein
MQLIWYFHVSTLCIFYNHISRQSQLLSYEWAKFPRVSWPVAIHPEYHLINDPLTCMTITGKGKMFSAQNTTAKLLASSPFKGLQCLTPCLSDFPPTSYFLCPITYFIEVWMDMGVLQKLIKLGDDNLYVQMEGLEINDSWANLECNFPLPSSICISSPT